MNFANVKSWIIQEGEVLQVKDSNNTRIIWQKNSEPQPDYSEPFYVENISNSNETVSIKKFSSSSETVNIYQSNDKTNWTLLGTTSTTPIEFTLSPARRVYLRANTNTLNGNNIKGCSKVGGNIMSLLYGDNFDGTETVFPGNTTYQFGSLFSGNTNLINAERLLLPATTLTNYCYFSMFENCTSLIFTPELPAMNLADYCYDNMFNGCTLLTSTPELPATTLSKGCYCYMFRNCDSLINITTLPATTLAKNCYRYMFAGCNFITTAPDLLAQTLVDDCYDYMFYGCVSLNYVKCLATSGFNYSEPNTSYWLFDAASTGTFVKAAGITWPSGSDGIPAGWTVQEV